MKKYFNFFKPFFSAANAGSSNMLIVIGVAGAALLIGKSLIDRGVRMNANIQDEITNREAKIAAQKVLAGAGFMVANNLVVCREEGFSRGNRCQWGNSRVFTLDSLGLDEPVYTKEIVRFPLKPMKNVFTSSEEFRLEQGDLTFELVDGRKEGNIEQFIGDRPKDLEMIDRDYSYVKVKVNMTYWSGKRKREASTLAYFRRPISIVTTLVKSDPVCTARCRSSISQNPYPSCRGQQEMEDSAKVDILIRTTNNGPGVLYDLTYQKQVCFYPNPGGSCQADSSFSKLISIPIKEALPVGGSLEWTDEVPCKKFVGVTNNSSNANAPQHVTNAGHVEYILDARNSDNKMEPFRMNYKVEASGDNFPGIMNLIYVEPTH